eukprot:scaffold15891_cov48-Phaeocystis_antarctica.AAC.1
MQEDLRLVRAPAALGAADAAAAACAARSRLQRPQRQEEMQDQDEEVQDEKAIDQVREEMQEGPQEEETVPEDLLRARLPRLNGPLEALVVANRPVSDPGWRWSNVPLGLKARERGSREGSRLRRTRAKQAARIRAREVREAVWVGWGWGGRDTERHHWTACCTGVYTFIKKRTTKTKVGKWRPSKSLFSFLLQDDRCDTSVNYCHALDNTRHKPLITNHQP